MLSAKQDGSRAEPTAPRVSSPSGGTVGKVVSSIQGLQQRLNDYSLEEVAAAENRSRTLLRGLLNLQSRMGSLIAIKRTMTVAYEAIEKAKELKKHYRLFLFSNTNAIHYECFMNIYRQQFGKDDFNDLFEKAYYSHSSGIRKPYIEAYEWVLQDAGISAAETLFIDDTYPNIEGAQKAGLQTIHLKPPVRLWELDFNGLNKQG